MFSGELLVQLPGPWIQGSLGWARLAPHGADRAPKPSGEWEPCTGGISMIGVPSLTVMAQIVWVRRRRKPATRV